jgi:hypothetical protein
VPFEVPADVEAIEFVYTHKGERANTKNTGAQKNVIDFALLDQDGVEVGGVGSIYKKIFISENYSAGYKIIGIPRVSLGYKRRITKEGTWTILLGAYQVRDEGVEVNYEITFYKKHYRWFTGDLHMHSANSDGNYALPRILKIAKKKSLEFIAVTDHNNTNEDIGAYSAQGMTVIPSLEFSHYDGHMNLYGVAKPYDSPYAINSWEEFLATINKEVDASGALKSINHPDCAMCPWLFPMDFDFQLLEVWNGPMRSDNVNNVAKWDKLLSEGRKIFGIGGSDFHKLYGPLNLMGMPVTRVYAFANTKDDILKAMSEGKCTISNNAKSTFLTIESGDKGMGETVVLTDDTSIIIKADKLKKGHTVALVSQGADIFTYTAERNMTDFAIEVPVKSKGYVRAEVRYPLKFYHRAIQNLLLRIMNPKGLGVKVEYFIWALTNPIFFE